MTNGSDAGSAARATEIIAGKLPSKPTRTILGIDNFTMVIGSDALDDRTGGEGKPTSIFPRSAPVPS
jgi:hypothetical protein